MAGAAEYSEMKRKAEHIAPLGFAFTLTIFPKWLVFTLSAASILYGIFVSKRVVKGTLREAELRRGFSIGKSAYGIMVLLLLILFHTRMQVVAGAWAIMALGDGSASIFGSRYGRVKLPWNNEKSYAGLAAFVIVGTLACLFLLWYIQATGRVGATIDVAFAAFPFDRLLVAAFATAFGCAVAETIRQPIDDNILVPLLAGLLLHLLTRLW